MRFSILATLCLVGSSIAAPVVLATSADNYYEIITRRVSQVGSTLQSLESHLRPGAPTNFFDRTKQQDQQVQFFRRAIDLNQQVVNAMREGAGEMSGRIPHNWKMSLGESTSFAGQALSLQSTLGYVLNDWSTLKSAATSVGAIKSIGNTLSNSAQVTSDFISHIMEHQNSLTSASGLDRTAKSIIENQLNKVVREYQSGW